jgi:hypothetical protein
MRAYISYITVCQCHHWRLTLCRHRQVDAKMELGSRSAVERSGDLLIRLVLQTDSDARVEIHVMCRFPTSAHPNASIVASPCSAPLLTYIDVLRPAVQSSLPPLLPTRWPPTSSHGLIDDAYCTAYMQHETRVTWLHLWLPELEAIRGLDLTCVYDAFVACSCSR